MVASVVQISMGAMNASAKLGIGSISPVMEAHAKVRRYERYISFMKCACCAETKGEIIQFGDLEEL